MSGLAPRALLLLAFLGPGAMPAAAGAGGFTVRGTAGARPVGAHLEVVADGSAQAPALAFERAGAGLVGRAEDARLRVEVSLQPGPGAGFEGRIDVLWKAAAQVERLGLRLDLPGPARALGRDLVLRPLRHPVRAEVGTPLLLLAGDLALVGGPGLVAARVAPTAPGSELLLLLDDAGSHPFAVYTRCLARLPAAQARRSWASLEHKRSLARTGRVPGDRDGAAFQLLALAPGEEARPLLLERWPGGARAALVLTDHADRTDPPALRAVLHGASDPLGPARRSRGILGWGLKLTKSFFARDLHGGLLDDPEAAVLAEELLAAGSEVALHSPGTGPDDRATVRDALEALAPYRMTTWIDHEPYTNCEAFSNQGWERGGRFGIRDLLLEAGFRWVWEANDLGGFGKPRLENLLFTAAPGEPDPPVFPFPPDARLWIFQTTFFYGPPAALGSALSEEGLDALEDAHGLFIGHTYLAASARTTRDAAHLRSLAVRPAPGGGLEIDPALDAGLARAAGRVRRGSLATLTLREAGDRLRALAGLRVVYQADGSARVENHGPGPVEALQIELLGEGALDVEGPEAGGHVRGDGHSHVFFDLGPGEAAEIRAHGAAGPLPFLAADAGATLAP